MNITIQGYHDWVAKEWTSYLDKEEATRVAEYIEYGCVKKSIELAEELGAYPAFNGSEWDNGNMFRKFIGRSVTDLNWQGLWNLCKIHGIRNSQLTSPAPNCQDPRNKVQVYKDREVVSKSIYEILADSNIHIEEVESNEPKWLDLVQPVLVPTAQGDSIVERIWYNGVQPTIDIEMEDGNIYSFTNNHMLKVLRGEDEVWVRCDQLTEDDELVNVVQ